jgi:toxin ParE1/3/4
MTRLVVTSDADHDAINIVAYLHREAGPRVAEDYGHRFQDTLSRLLDMPESGAPRPALGRNIRIAIVLPYLLIYEYTRHDDTLTLLRVVHGKRNITRELLQR